MFTFSCRGRRRRVELGPRQGLQPRTLDQRCSLDKYIIVTTKFFSIETNTTFRRRLGVQACKFEQRCRRGRFCKFTHNRSRAVVEREKLQKVNKWVSCKNCC